MAGFSNPGVSRKTSEHAALAVEAFILAYAGFTRQQIARFQGTSRIETISKRVTEVKIHLQEVRKEFRD